MDRQQQEHYEQLKTDALGIKPEAFRTIKEIRALLDTLEQLTEECGNREQTRKLIRLTMKGNKKSETLYDLTWWLYRTYGVLETRLTVAENYRRAAEAENRGKEKA
jgi:hypothetical protein